MIIVIIAGGSGTRLWPLSTPEYPKHLLSVNNDDRSLLQHTYDRAKALSDHIYVVSEVSHIDHVKAQLSELDDDNFIVEPGRRGTAHCILAALTHVAKRHASDETLVAIHADHYIRDTDGFVQSFKIATTVSAEQNRLVLVGVEPDYPATGFGYIEKGSLLDEASLVYNVESFKEKPDHVLANSYIASGHYLWNCGYFVGSLNVFAESMQNFAPELHANYQALLNSTDETYTETYLSFDSIAIDYALIERMDNLLVAPAAFDWMDVGSFADLHKAVESDDDGNYQQGAVETEEVTNSFVENKENKPVVVIGLDNVVVVNTPQGILVSRKDLSQKVGDVSKRLNARSQ